MIDKENQVVQVSLKDYEELLELKWMFEHTLVNKDDFMSSFYNIISNRIAIDTYNNSIKERKYNDAEEILRDLMAHIRYVFPELYEKFEQKAKENAKSDEKEKK